jgi:hypothetical protein
MRVLCGFTLALCLIALFHNTSSAAVSLGTNFGVTVHRLSGASSSTTIIEWPNSAGDLEPGLRVGFRPADPHHELYLNSGLIHQSSSGSNSHVIEATVNYQYNFLPESATSGYATLGGGLLSIGGSSGSGATSGLFGGGLGVRVRVADGYGSLRVEARYDRLGESDRLSGASLFGLRLGFDLWMK